MFVELFFTSSFVCHRFCTLMVVITFNVFSWGRYGVKLGVISWTQVMDLDSCSVDLIRGQGSGKFLFIVACFSPLSLSQQS